MKTLLFLLVMVLALAMQSCATINGFRQLEDYTNSSEQKVTLK